VIFRGHPQVYSQEEMHQFDANFQKQLAFNLCATCATRKKSATINKAWASRLHNVDFDELPTLFSLYTMDCHELSAYVLEEVLGCQVGC
jgi:hypothetical protein